jgi:hypothetical protein
LGTPPVEPGTGGIEWALCEIGKDELPAVGEEGLGDHKTDPEGPAGDDCHAAIGR